jgi:hypothetical protein
MRSGARAGTLFNLKKADTGQAIQRNTVLINRELFLGKMKNKPKEDQWKPSVKSR